MNKAQRLLRLLNLLQARRTAITAEAIAGLLEVSQRTVYRDVQALIALGLPISGEAGVGYLLQGGHALPPLMFTPDEVLALMVGARMVQALTDPELGRAAAQAEQKIQAALPPRLQAQAERQPYRVPVLARDAGLRELHGRLRRACEQQRKIRIAYVDERQATSERVLWPLGIIGWSGHWSLLAWCELRSAYRNFRFERMQQAWELEQHFSPSAEISLEHYLRSC